MVGGTGKSIASIDSYRPLARHGWCAALVESRASHHPGDRPRWSAMPL